MEIVMKRLTVIATAALMAVAAHAYAGESDAPTGTSDNNAEVVSQATSVSAQPAVPMTGSIAPVGKTRAEVYQELLRAQNDGALARLNALLYSGG
jgi:hypothetical protein